jgi:hypothetical protein
MNSRAKPQKAASAVTMAAVASNEVATQAPPKDQAEDEEGELQHSGSKYGKRATDRILQKRGEPTKKRKANARDIRWVFVQTSFFFSHLRQRRCYAPRAAWRQS